MLIIGVTMGIPVFDASFPNTIDIKIRFCQLSFISNIILFLPDIIQFSYIVNYVRKYQLNEYI